MSLKRKYCVAFINDTNYINPDYIEKVQNLMSYWYMELSTQVKVKSFTYYESAFEFARDYNYDHLICVKPGNDFEIKGRFIEKLDNFLNDDIVIAGHILDKGNRYYELHNQCFYINVKIWKELGCPDIGHSNDGSIDCIEPIRSAENFHDDYTPYYIKPSSVTKTYSNLKFGYNLINSFLKAGYTINAFDEKVRNSKFFAYPEDPEVHERYKQLYNFNFIKKYYLYNTEKQRLENIPNKKIKRFATVCAGLNHLKVLKDKGYSKDTKLLFYDWDEFSVEIMKSIYNEWDGKNYEEFIYSKSQSLKYNGNIVEDHNLSKEFFNFFGGEESFAEWFIKLKNTVHIEFHNIDIMNLKDNIFVEFFNCEGFKLFWLSNIFHYKPTSMIYSLEDRAKMQDNIILSLPKEENMYVFSDSCILDQSKIFSTPNYKIKTCNAIEVQKEILT